MHYHFLWMEAYQGNNSLVLIDVVESDRGQYKCRAANRLGAAFDAVSLIVEGATNYVLLTR